jgi:hypothetical protein
MKPSQKAVKCIDWSQIVVDLERCGLTQREIAGECGFPDTDKANGGGKYWVNRLKNIPNTQPNFHEGALLLGLWADRMRRPLADLPRAEYRYVRNESGRVVALPMVDRTIPAETAASGVDSHRTPDAS